MHSFNIEKSGATLALEFFEKVKGGPLIQNEKEYENFVKVWMHN